MKVPNPDHLREELAGLLKRIRDKPLKNIGWLTIGLVGSVIAIAVVAVIENRVDWFMERESSAKQIVDSAVIVVPPDIEDVGPTITSGDADQLILEEELASSDLRSLLCDAIGYAEGENVSGREEALRRYRRLVESLTDVARRELPQELLWEAMASYDSLHNEHALRCYRELFSNLEHLCT